MEMELGQSLESDNKNDQTCNNPMWHAHMSHVNMEYTTAPIQNCLQSGAKNLAIKHMSNL